MLTGKLYTLAGKNRGVGHIQATQW